ncbi:MAG: hypothetical protein PQ975_04250 [Methanobacterium sp.]|jgi:purine-cytosine permease-like protein
MSALTEITTNIINNGLLLGIALVAFLVLKEVFGADADKNKEINSFIRFIDLIIVLLFIIFMIVVGYKAFTVLSNL